MPQNNPTLFKRKGSRWWWYSWYTKDGRILASCRKPLGLSVDKYTKEEALDILLHHLGCKKTLPESGTVNVGWFKSEILKRLSIENLCKTTIKEYRIAIDYLMLGVENAVGAIRMNKMITSINLSAICKIFLAVTIREVYK